MPRRKLAYKRERPRSTDGEHVSKLRKEADETSPSRSGFHMSLAITQPEQIVAEDEDETAEEEEVAEPIKVDGEAERVAEPMVEVDVAPKEIVGDDKLSAFYRSVTAYFQYGFQPDQLIDLVLVIHILPSTLRYLTMIEETCPNVRIAALVAKSSVPHEEALIGMEEKFGKRLIRGMKNYIHESEILAERLILSFCNTGNRIAIFDMGGYFAKFLANLSATHPLFERILLSVEDTRNGEDVYQPLMSQIPVPVCCVEDPPGIPGVKAAENSEVAHSIVDATWPILQSKYQINLKESPLKIGVIGFGKIGEHIALYLKNKYHCNDVLVYDNNDSRMLSASRTFTIVGSVEELLEQSDLVFSATGKGSFSDREIVQLSQQRLLPLYVASCTSAETEFRGNFGKPVDAVSDKKSVIYAYQSGFKLHMLKGGNAMNFPEANIEPNIHAVMAAHLVFLYRAILGDSLRLHQINYLSSDETYTLARLFLRSVKGIALRNHMQLVRPVGEFVGRKEELKSLFHSFMPTYPDAFSSNRVVLLYGKEGVGTTELARKFAEHNSDNYNLIYYGSLAVSESVEDFYLEFARFFRLNIEGVDNAETVIFNFLSLQQNFLLIVDNIHRQEAFVEALQQKLMQFSESAGRKHILCVGTYASTPHHLLYTIDELRPFIRLPRNPAPTLFELSGFDDQDLEEFLLKNPTIRFNLKQLPTALFLKLTPLILFLLSKQFDLFNLEDEEAQFNHAAKILSEGENPIEQIVYFSLSKADDMGKTAIAKLTFVDPDEIPNSFFEPDEVSFLQATGLLDGKSHLDGELQRDEHYWRVPAGIQAAIKKAFLSHIYITFYQTNCVNFLVSFADTFTYHYYSAPISTQIEIEKHQYLLHHLFFILECIKRSPPTKKEFKLETYRFPFQFQRDYMMLLRHQEKVIGLFLHIGDFYLNEVRNYRLARQFYSYALELIPRTGRLSSCVDIFKARGFLGYAINDFMSKRDRGEANDFIDVSEKFVKIAKRIFDRQDEDPLAKIYAAQAGFQLSFIYDLFQRRGVSGRGDPFEVLTQAKERLLLATENLEEGWMVTRNRMLALIHHQFGSLYKRSQQYDLAEQSFAEALRLRHDLDPSHPDLARTKFRLAEVYYDKKDFFKALVFAKEAKAAQLAHLSEEHPNVLAAKALISRIESSIQAGEEFEQFAISARSAPAMTFFKSPGRRRGQPKQSRSYESQSLPRESPLPVPISPVLVRSSSRNLNSPLGYGMMGPPSPARVPFTLVVPVPRPAGGQ